MCPVIDDSSNAAAAEAQHRPVLLAEVLEWAAVRPGCRVLDCTLGLGGHASALQAQGALITGIDRDPKARAQASQRLGPIPILAGPFADQAEALVRAEQCFDVVLADLGVSSMQLDDPARGFSIRSQEALDLRMDPGVGPSALEEIGRLDQEALASVLREYGEERCAGRVARVLKEAEAAGLRAAADYAERIRRVVPGRHKRHPALRSFQALRILVNDELGQLRRLLAALPALLAEGGVALVISFHSLEDRLVKQSFRAGMAEGLFSAISKRVLRATPAEVADNRRAAPARLRWARAQQGGET